MFSSFMKYLKDLTYFLDLQLCKHLGCFRVLPMVVGKTYCRQSNFNVSSLVRSTFDFQNSLKRPKVVVKYVKFSSEVFHKLFFFQIKIVFPRMSKINFHNFHFTELIWELSTTYPAMDSEWRREVVGNDAVWHRTPPKNVVNNGRFIAALSGRVQDRETHFVGINPKQIRFSGFLYFH